MSSPVQALSSTKAVCLPFKDVNLLQSDTWLEKGRERLSLQLSDPLVTICRWNPQLRSSLNTPKEAASRHTGMCPARPKQSGLLDTLQGQFYKPKEPPPRKLPSPLPGQLPSSMLGKYPKIQRRGPLIPRLHQDFLTEGHSSRAESLPRNRLRSDTRDRTRHWFGKQKVIFGMQTS